MKVGDPPARRVSARQVVIVVLLGIAVVWPFVEIGPKGSEIVQLMRGHGVDTRDLLSIIPLTIALALALPYRRVRARDRS